MSEVVELRPPLKGASEMEVEFYQTIDAVLCEFQDRGMTPSWQVGCLELINLQMMEGDDG